LNVERNNPIFRLPGIRPSATANVLVKTANSADWYPQIAARLATIRVCASRRAPPITVPGMASA
jgi:hypothetical protein